MWLILTSIHQLFLSVRLSNRTNSFPLPTVNMQPPAQQSSLCKQAVRSFANILCKMEFVFLGSEERITSNGSPDEVSEQSDILRIPLHVYIPCSGSQPGVTTHLLSGSACHWHVIITYQHSVQWLGYGLEDRRIGVRSPAGRGSRPNVKLTITST